MDKMVGILFFTTNEVLEHKKRDGKFSEGNECWWSLTKFPKHKVDRIYFAVKGQVKGYFKIALLDKDANELIFNSETWTPLEEGEILKASQSWRYYK